MKSPIVSIRVNAKLLAEVDLLAESLGKTRTKLILDLVETAVLNARLTNDPEHIRDHVEKDYPFRRSRR